MHTPAQPPAVRSLGGDGALTFELRTEAGQCVVVRGERIVPSSSALSLSMDLGAGELRAGLINSHDHLFLNHFPRLGSPPYRSMYAWADDVQHRFAAEVDRYSTLPRRDALLFGALKNLLGGVTTVVHHDPWREHLDSGFPLRVERVRVIHSLGLESDLEAALAGSEDMKGRPVCMHLAEGVGDDAASEVHEAAARGLMDGHLMAVHLVTVDLPGIELLRAANAAFVWCPTSNLFLYGRTSPPELFESGIDVLLGTDSLLSGAGTLLDELRTAHEVGHLDEDRLVGAVGEVAARRLGLPEPTLEPGGVGDVVFLRRPLLEARPRDVGLVLVGGKPRLGDAEFAALFERTGVSVEPLEVGGVPKLVVAPLATVAREVVELSPSCDRILR